MFLGGVGVWLNAKNSNFLRESLWMAPLTYNNSYWSIILQTNFMLSFFRICLGITCLFKSNYLTLSQEDDHYVKMIIALMLREGVKSCIADVVLRDR